MANTRQSTKRAKQEQKRKLRNTAVRSDAKSVLRAAGAAIAKKSDTAKDAFAKAVKSLSKAATKGAIPKKRAARKISRLTKMAQKQLPKIF